MSREQHSIRTYRLRKGRVTRAQRRALKELLPQYQLPESPTTLDWSEIFGPQVPIGLEIGIGSGEALLELARNHLHWGWVGIEVYPPGVGKCLLRLHEQQLDNVRIALGDAIPFLEGRIPQKSLDVCYIFFPDPWPKARHHKRRLIQRPFLDLLARTLRPHGEFYLATDWPDYAEWMVATLEAHPQFENCWGATRYAPRCPDRPLTRFELRGQGQGHPVFDLHYRRIASP